MAEPRIHAVINENYVHKSATRRKSVPSFRPFPVSICRSTVERPMRRLYRKLGPCISPLWRHKSSVQHLRVARDQLADLPQVARCTANHQSTSAQQQRAEMTADAADLRGISDGMRCLSAASGPPPSARRSAQTGTATRARTAVTA